MVKPECFVAENQQTEHDKDRQGDNFLKYFQLDETEWSAIALIANAVGRHLKHIFEKSYCPTYQYNPCKVELIESAYVLEFQMTIPGKRHKGIGQNQQGNSSKRFHRINFGAKFCFFLVFKATVQLGCP